jgi:serine/threonine protein kinase/Leucine-rich repeat (LRR) protein
MAHEQTQTMIRPIHEEEIFQVAAAMPAGERAVYLDAVCGTDLIRRGRIERLLESHEAPGFMHEAGAPFSPEQEEQFARLKPEEGGEMIGPYKLREQIGEGGFGTVWVADQEKPVRRRVALKIIKLGMDTKEVIARFEQERQALALMEHPNIAKVLDAGATQWGRPYFVMELVRGVRITDYCDDQQLSTKERIALFITVCQAVQHAHQKGIIHRDLKPSNILVTINDGVAVPKVIDFGVAKATQGRLTDQTVYTQFQQMVGTPLYMSPEQAELTSLDIDTRSDIYALGVLLYELLTGRTPIDSSTMAQVGLDEMRRLIREVDPPRPSARLETLDGNELTTVAKRRHTDPARLPGALSGDLDWIVMRCLEKDRKRRYDTANGLALDLQRHLQNEAITARPPTTAYLLGKLIRRNKVSFAAGAAVAASLLIGTAVSLWQAVRVGHEKQRAVIALEELRATAPAFVEQARALVASERFDEALEKLVYAAKLRPDSPDILVAQGDVLQCQFRLAEAAAAYRAALVLRPGDARAKGGASLCDELLGAPPGPDGKLSRESLSKLHLAMQRQQRSAAELMPVARRLGEERKFVADYWIGRLKALPVSSDRPLKQRLTVRDDGLLALDLSDSKVADLTPLIGAPIGALSLSGCDQLADFAPLGELRSLTVLSLIGTEIGDLTPLRGLLLKELYLTGTRVFEITALQGMPLRKLSLRNTRVADLTPLAGLPLSYFDASAIPATDYAPLAGAPLDTCIIQNSPLRDLSFLRGSPVRQLNLYNCKEARGFGVLASLKSLDLLVLPQTFRALPDEDLAAIAALRDHPKLSNIQTEERPGGWTIGTVQAKEYFWKDWDREQAFLPALRQSGFRFSLSKLPAGTYSLTIANQPLRDLSFLRGAPISTLILPSCQVSDVTPLRDLPLDFLVLFGNPIADITPLQGLQIKTLSLTGTRVSDLSALMSLPLKEVYLDRCEALTDVSALTKVQTLEKVTLPLGSRDIEALRALPNLQLLSFQVTPNFPFIPDIAAEEFWRRWPALTWLRSLGDAGMKFTASYNSAAEWTVTVHSKQFRDCTVFKAAKIRELILSDTSVADLDPLKELALTKLHLSGTEVTSIAALRAPVLSGSLREVNFWKTRITDFSPLSACRKLEVLDISDTALADLSIVRGCRLRVAQLSNTKVSDISVLAGMPLTRVTLRGTAVRDVRPLLQCPTLEEIVLPAAARDVAALRALPALTGISFGEQRGGAPAQKATAFWRHHEAKEKSAPPLPENL